MNATILDVVRCGRDVTLAVGVNGGLLEIVDKETGTTWPGSLTREERALAKEKLSVEARLQEARSAARPG